MTDFLLKPGERRQGARNALSRFDRTLLPVYAIKEFNAGPLSAYRWLHNVLVNEKSYARAIKRLHALSRTPQRYMTSTALEAIAVVTAAAAGQSGLGALVEKYGPEADPDRIAADEIRLGLRSLIIRAWRKRRMVTTEVVNPLSCYAEGAITSERGLIVLGPRDCTLEPNCCMAVQFRARLRDLQALKSAVESQEKTREQQKKYQALRRLERTSRPLDRKECRALGDAVFAFFAPNDAIILTTNVKDHQPLAEALGKSVERP